MQLVSSRIWTRVAVSISYDDNHYTTGTSTLKMLPISYLFRNCPWCNGFSTFLIVAFSTKIYEIRRTAFIAAYKYASITQGIYVEKSFKPKPKILVLSYPPSLYRSHLHRN